MLRKANIPISYKTMAAIPYRKTNTWKKIQKREKQTMININKHIKLYMSNIHHKSG